MADREEKVVYKVVVDDSDLPDELNPVPKGSGGTPPPLPHAAVEGSATPGGAAPQRVQVSRVFNDAHMVEMFARLVRTPQFSSGMAQSLFGFAQRAGLGQVFAKAGAQAAAGAPVGGAAAEAGVAGGLAGAVPIAAIALAAGMVLKNLHEGSAMMVAGRNQILGGALGADPSSVIKGGFGVYRGAFHMAAMGGMNPAATVLEKVAESGQKVVDVLDKMSDQFAKFNGSIAASEAQLKVAQVQANIRMAQGFSPLLTQWNQLKGHVTDITSKLAAFAGSVLSGIADGFMRTLNSFASAVNWLLDKIGLGKSGQEFGAANMAALLRGAVTPSTPNVRSAIGGQLQGIIGTTAFHGPDEAQQAARAAEQARKRLADIQRQRAKDKGESAEEKKEGDEYEAKLRKQIDELDKKAADRSRRGKTGGIGIPAVPFVYHAPNAPQSPERIPYDDPGKAAARAAANDEKRLADIRKDRSRNRGQESEEERRKGDQYEADIQRRIDENKRKAAQAQPAPFVPVEFRQNVQLNAQYAISHQKEIHDAITSIRKMLEGALNVARNEARLSLNLHGLNQGAVI